MTNAEFSEKYNIRKFGRCCGTCQYSKQIPNSNNVVQCNNPELEHENGECLFVDKTNICFAWKKIMSKEEMFMRKYNIHSIEKCCWTCKYLGGYDESPECHHPEAYMDMESYANVCDAWEKKE